MKHSDLFEFEEWASFGGAGQESLLEDVSIKVDHKSETLNFQKGNTIIACYPIPRNEQGISILWVKSESKVYLGNVTFISPHHLPHLSKRGLNVPEEKFSCQISLHDGGGMIVTDIRDMGRVTFDYQFDLVPLTLNIEGNDLVISTTTFDPVFGLPAWYQEVNNDG